MPRDSKGLPSLWISPFWTNTSLKLRSTGIRICTKVTFSARNSATPLTPLARKLKRISSNHWLLSLSLQMELCTMWCHPQRPSHPLPSLWSKMRKKDPSPRWSQQRTRSKSIGGNKKKTRLPWRLRMFIWALSWRRGRSRCGSWGGN